MLVFSQPLLEDIHSVALGCSHKNEKRQLEREVRILTPFSPSHSWPITAWRRWESRIVGSVKLHKWSDTYPLIQSGKDVEGAFRSYTCRFTWRIERLSARQRVGGDSRWKVDALKASGCLFIIYCAVYPLYFTCQRQSLTSCFPLCDFYSKEMQMSNRSKSRSYRLQSDTISSYMTNNQRSLPSCLSSQRDGWAAMTNCVPAWLSRKVLVCRFRWVPSL